VLSVELRGMLGLQYAPSVRDWRAWLRRQMRDIQAISARAVDPSEACLIQYGSGY